MTISGHLRSSAGLLVRLHLRHNRSKFLASLQDCQATQARVLASLLDLNRDSRFAAAHGLDRARSVTDLRNCLPVTQYDFYSDAIESLRQGDSRALLGSHNPLLMFALSSGTTSGSKFIPVTQRFYDDYRRGWQAWGIKGFDEFPLLKRLKIFYIAGDYNRFRTDGGTPCGNISGLVAVMQRRAIRMLYTLPAAISQIAEPDTKYYTALRLGLADPEIGMVMTANPSTLIRVAQVAEQNREQLIRDVFDGTLNCQDRLPGPIAKALSRQIAKRNPVRARELEACVERTGHLSPKDFWPLLQFLAVWTAGSCAAYLPSLREHYGQSTAIRDHGLSASEGRMTIPFDSNSPDGVLDISSHYFEFIPEDEYDTPDPVVLEAHELQPDRNYYILLTTSSGLYRYDICDVVRCVGFTGTTPVLRFLHKGAHISSITGEKLSESQIVSAVQETLAEFDHRADRFTMVPVWGEPPRYELLFENSDMPASHQLTAFSEQVESRLSQSNCEYGEKRTTSRLAEIRTRSVPYGAWQHLAEMRQSEIGGSSEQYKHPYLIPDMKKAATVRKEFEQLPAADCVAT